VRFLLVLGALTLASMPAFSAIFGSVRGIIHDPQHHPVENAMVMIHAKTSDWSASTTSDANGEFLFNAVPLGEYSVTVAAKDFNPMPSPASPIRATISPSTRASISPWARILGKNLSLRHGPQCGKSPRRARQQRYLRRISLE
jgi:Carboxypeptidase regulatory-like domain